MSTIDPTIVTSRVFDATLAVYDRLCEMVFPKHPVTGGQPAVHLVSDPGWEAGEYISVLANEDPAVREWALASPASTDEIIVIDVLIRSMIAGTTQRATVERLWALADPAQMITYDVTAGKPKLVGFKNENRTGRSRDVSFNLTPTAEGYIGDALLRFALAAQI